MFIEIYMKAINILVLVYRNLNESRKHTCTEIKMKAVNILVQKSK